MKKWIDADEVIKMTIEVPEDLKKFEEEMRKIPNFDHSEVKKKDKKKTRTEKY